MVSGVTRFTFNCIAVWDVLERFFTKVLVRDI